MSLQVWLPLNESESTVVLKNLGLNNSTIPLGHWTRITNGKIGTCIRTTSESIDTTFNGNAINAGSISFGGWFKFNRDEIANVLNNVAVNSTRTTPTGNIIGNSSYGGISIQWNANNMYSSGSFTSLYAFASIRTSSGGIIVSSVIEIKFDVWFHLFITYNKALNKMSFYVNGQLFNERSIFEFSDAPSRNIFINYSGVYSGNGPGVSIPYYVNDVRIYDHCLSPREVADIAQGLVLHYKLDDGDVEGTTNLHSGYLGGTCYNGAKGTYGYGTSTDMYKTIGDFQGKSCTKVYMGTASASASPYVFFDGIHPANGSYKALSFDYFPTQSQSIYFYTYNGSATLKYSINGSNYAAYSAYQAIPVILNEWNHVELVLYGTSSNTSGFGYMVIGSFTSTTTDYWLFANIQVEEKDHATPYAGPNGTRSQNIVYDSSGFGNHGSIVNTMVLCDNSPRYSKGVDCSSNRKILTNSFEMSSFGNSYSIAWWALGSSASQQMMIGFTNGNRLNVMHTLCLNTGDSQQNPFYIPGTTTRISCPSTTEWHHYVLTGDGSSSKLYVDGIHYGTAKYYRAITGSQICINGWSTSNDYNFNGKYSDFRIYATALSPEDIKELYAMGASIDNEGNVECLEGYEINDAEISHTGQVRFDDILETYDYLYLPIGSYVNTGIPIAVGDELKILLEIRWEAGGSGRDLMGWSTAAADYFGVTAAGAWEKMSGTYSDITVHNFGEYKYIATSAGTFHVGALVGSYMTRAKYIYHMTIEKNGVLIADLWPAYSRKECGLVNIVTNDFYPANTPEAVVGNDDNPKQAKIYSKYVECNQILEI